MNVVDDKTVLEVGKFYNVRCAEICNGFNGYKFTYVPIIGNAHKDIQFGIDKVHYHIDGRFAKLNGNYSVDEFGETNTIVYAEKPQNFGMYHAFDFMDKIVIKRLKCRRLTTSIKPPLEAKQYWDWYDTMLGKSCAGRKCPHLGTTMGERDGKLVCPLHNLHGCIKTEKIIAI